MRRTWADPVTAGVATGVVLASTVLAVSSDRPTTYAAAGPWLAVASVVPGWALLLAGTVAVWSGRRPTGRLTTALAVVWMAPVWVGWVGGEPAVRSIAMLVVPFAPALLLHLALTAPEGRVRSGSAGRALAAAYTATLGLTLLRATVRDPFLDRYCWDNCSENLFLVRAEPGLARVLDTVWAWLVLAGGIAIAAVGVRSLWAASSVGRRRWAPVLVPTAAAALGESARSGLLLIARQEDPTVAAFAIVHVYRAATWTAVALGVAWLAVRVRRTTADLHRLVDAWAASPTGAPLAMTLKTTLRDPTVELAYWLPDPGCWVDPEGRSVPRPGPDRLATPLVRGGAPVALLLHDPALPLTPEDTAGIGAAARLAVDNERLRAALLHQLADLRDSRARVVAVADSTRRRIERDLHDGAQQLLLALTFELRMAATAAARGPGAAQAPLARACAEAQAAVVELRTLAHGIHPAVLTESGMGAALRTLGDTAPVPVEVRRSPDERFGAGVELAVYLLVADLVSRATAPVVVDVRRSGGTLVTSVAPARDTPGIGLLDRLAALDGRVELRGATLWAEVPCE